jgi:hypothetical protein
MVTPLIFRCIVISIMLVAINLIHYTYAKEGKIKMSQLKHNGVEWIYFGNGIFDSSKLIEVSLNINGVSNRLSISDPQKIAEINNWLISIFREKMNFSPVDPLYESVEFLNYITLYSTLAKHNESILIRIPLTPFTMSCSESDFEKNLLYLHELSK